MGLEAPASIWKDRAGNLAGHVQHFEERPTVRRRETGAEIARNTVTSTLVTKSSVDTRTCEYAGIGKSINLQ